MLEDTGNIYVLDEEYNFRKSFNYLGIDEVDKCISVYKGNELLYYCAYYQDNNLGLLAFEYNQNNIPEYIDYYSITTETSFLDLNYVDDTIYFTTESGVYSSSINSNLKLPWDTVGIDLRPVGAISEDEILFLVKNTSNIILIVDANNTLVKEFEFNSDNFVDAIIIDSYISVLTKDQIVVYDTNYQEVNSFSINSSAFTSFVSNEISIVTTIKNQGFTIGDINNLYNNHILPNSTPSIDAYNSIRLLEDGGVVAIGNGIDEDEDFYSGILHYNGADYINYTALHLSSSYYIDDSSNIITIDYISGQKNPASIVELDNGNIIFSNSGLILSPPDSQNIINRGGAIELNLESQQITNIFNSHNSMIGGMQGIYWEAVDNNYSVINQIIKYNNKIWVVNPYDELFGKVLSSYNLLSYEWSGIDVSNPDDFNESNILYMPQEMTFDNSGQLWVSFRSEPILSSSNAPYSYGGIRYINSNNQLKKVENDEILIGGENSDIWSIDVCSYEGSDVLWVLSSDGVQGYTIFNNELSSILGLDLFIDLPFYQGDHIRCDQYSNVWITTRHSGVRALLSETNYTESWPSFSGMNQDNSGLLSNIVYDIDFDDKTGEIYFSTDLGISILESPFGEILYTQNDEYKIYFDNNPFLVPKDERVVISNVPIGSTLKIMTLNGKILRTLNEESFTMYEWDGKDKTGSYVPSGVYIVVSSNLEEKIAVGKLAVIREK